MPFQAAAQPNREISESVGNDLISPSQNAPESEEFADMAKERLKRELVEARNTDARLKKGYEVKEGDTETKQKALFKCMIKGIVRYKPR